MAMLSVLPGKQEKHNQEFNENKMQVNLHHMANIHPVPAASKGMSAQ
jgi:hypothetical protein